MRIPLGIPEIQQFCLKQLKTAYFKHFEQFPAFEIFEIIKFTANHCKYVFKYGHSNLTFTTVEQKIAWEYL